MCVCVCVCTGQGIQVLPANDGCNTVSACVGERRYPGVCVREKSRCAVVCGREKV